MVLSSAASLSFSAPQFEVYLPPRTTYIRYNRLVLGSLLIPAGIFMMEYKTKEELMLQPRTFAEHLEENSDSDTSSLSGETSYSDTSSSDSEEETCNEKMTRQHANSEKEPLPLGFQQLMMDKLHFTSLKDCIMNGNGLIVTPQNQKHSSRCPNMRNPSTYVWNSHMYNDEGDPLKKHQRSISWRRKLREFYSAPITTFWIWSLSFYIFLIALSYTLLIKTERYPTWVECYLISYVVVWLIELLRKLVMIVMIDRKQKIWRKVVFYFGNYRNGVLLVATTTYVIAFLMRCDPSSRMIGRVLLVCNSVLWSLKLLDYLRVFRQLGPYITMAAEMIPRMLPILSMVFVALLAFGLIREAITYPYENWSWLLVRNIFYKPYFMLYGEVYAARDRHMWRRKWVIYEKCNSLVLKLMLSSFSVWSGYGDHSSGPSKDIGK
ncbi:Ion transport protein [Parelaphostrongylus tenuis]|uniref:Ion transport protein n=1 Tax=Parelaphostrongylus tenuis TaxID=148309 RepID=A0AAD5MQE1_PARTN|nr:Ion transport protein [Parelaphostrongylus tenuis]